MFRSPIAHATVVHGVEVVVLHPLVAGLGRLVISYKAGTSWCTMFECVCGVFSRNDPFNKQMNREGRVGNKVTPCYTRGYLEP